MRKLVLLVLSSMAAAIFVLGVTPSVSNSQTQDSFVDVFAGGDKSFAFKNDGSAWKWGDVDYEGQDFPLFAPEFSSAKDIAAGPYHTLTLKNDGTVWASGDNYDGALGVGIEVEYTGDEAVQVEGPNGEGFLTGVKAIAAGYGHSAALKEDGTVWTWGYNWYGQIGDGTSGQFEDKFHPVQVKGLNGEGFLTGITAIDAGEYGTVALKDDGTVWAWGYSYMTGQGVCCSNKSTPVQVKGPGGQGFLTGITAIATGSEAGHVLALKDDGTVWTWGYDSYLPVQVKGENGQGTLSGVTDIGAGAAHSLAIKTDGTAWAWGYNGAGQLGDGTFVDKTNPVQVKGKDGVGFLTNVTELAAGENHTLAVTGDGTVWGWGYDEYGQMGDRIKTIRTPTPVQPVFAANNAPAVYNFDPYYDAQITDRTPTVGASVSDYETNLTKSNITLKFNGRAVKRSKFTYDTTTDRLTYTRTRQLGYGWHRFSIKATDSKGLTTTETSYFEIPTP